MRRCRADNFISVARAHYATFTGHIFSFNRCGTSNLVKVSLSVAWSQQDILRNEQPKNWHEKKEKETQWKWNEKKNGFSAATSFHDCQFSVFVFLFWRSRFYHWRRWQAEMNLSLYICTFYQFFFCVLDICRPSLSHSHMSTFRTLHAMCHLRARVCLCGLWADHRHAFANKNECQNATFQFLKRKNNMSRHITCANRRRHFFF